MKKCIMYLTNNERIYLREKIKAFTVREDCSLYSCPAVITLHNEDNPHKSIAKQTYWFLGPYLRILTESSVEGKCDFFFKKGTQTKRLPQSWEDVKQTPFSVDFSSMSQHTQPIVGFFVFSPFWMRNNVRSLWPRLRLRRVAQTSLFS